MKSNFTSVDELKASGLIAYEVVAGSRMYGLHNKDSDWDIRGMYAVHSDSFICVDSLKPQGEVSSDKQDVKYFELSKFIELAQECNPNVAELLWPPDDCVRVMTPLMEEMMLHRGLFVTKKAAMSFVGYARDQIAKATGQNKMVNNAQPEKEPEKEDFCWIVPFGGNNCWVSSTFFDRAPGKPVKISNLKIVDPKKVGDPNCRPNRENGFGQAFHSPLKLSECHVAAMEHVPDAYRLYHYGEGAKGVFRGDGMLVCESIPIEDEDYRFMGLLFYNKPGYEKAHRDWKRYWTWMRERNPARWVGQDGGKFQYDHKNMMHCMRLLLSGVNMIEKGEPIVRFEGDDLKFLMEVRQGLHQYEWLMGKAEEMIQHMDAVADKSPLPARPDVHKVNALYNHLRGMADQRIDRGEIKGAK